MIVGADAQHTPEECSTHSSRARLSVRGRSSSRSRSSDSQVASIVAGGGLTRNAMLMQIYADVTGRSIAVAGAPQASALGAAMLGAVAAGRPLAGTTHCSSAVANAWRPAPAQVYRPIACQPRAVRRVVR